MSHSTRFPSRSFKKKFEKTLILISQKDIQENVMKAVEGLEQNPRPFGHKAFKILTPPIKFNALVAQYRLRVGNYRILYDVDDDRKIVWILFLKKRDEKTYKA